MTYIVGHPIKYPADFYGRQSEISRFFEIVGGTQAQSVSVIGMRRSGKTSFLQYISNNQTMRNYLRQPENVTMIYLDVSRCKTPADFYYRLLQRLRYALGDINTGFLWRQSPPASTTMYDVEAYLCQFPYQRIILLLDEFDHIRTDTFSPEFLTELRAMTSVMDYDLACVTASHRDLFYLGTQVGLPPTSPFYNIFYPSPIFLSGLDKPVLKDLICNPAANEGITFTDEEVEEIIKLAGSLPFFVQATAVQILARKKENQSLNWEQLSWRLAADLSPYFEQWWRSLPLTDREVLQTIVKSGTVQSVQSLNYPKHILSETVRLLISYGLLAFEEDSVVINGSIFSNWIEQYAALVEEKITSSLKKESVVNLTSLRQAIIESFNLDELRALCFDLKLDYESLPGEGKFAKAQSLIEYYRNRRQLEKLITAVRNERGAII